MKRITLFSTLTENNLEIILGQIFPKEISNKVIAYMPSNGIKYGKEYIKQWENYAQKYGAKFNVIDNTTNNINEQKKLLDSNILIITGGNTFNLLHNLRNFGLDKTIMEFIKKPEFVLAGFSAGALVLTPNIKICDLPPDNDENIIGLNDLTGLGIVDFEVFPHYEKVSQEKILNDYKKTTPNNVKEISDEDHISINL